MSQGEVLKFLPWEAELRESETQQVFKFINFLSKKRFFNKKSFCARSSISKNDWYADMKKAQEKSPHPSFPLVLTDRFKLRLLLNILLHVPLLVKHIELAVAIDKEQSPLVLGNPSTIILRKHKKFQETKELIKHLREELFQLFGAEAKILVENIKTYEELAAKADELNSMFKNQKKKT